MEAKKTSEIRKSKMEMLEIATYVFAAIGIFTLIITTF